ncbi:hypothetical protein L21SP3_01587 [Sedimentisphaera cyanobacteriorum]|uniref:Uncharacterized protein n=1 Tax=Sedimentisphaera cyanobacteriorum TaxID=1940790 RepID=A0A1Q2HR80_9BACT|nr:hypothetical protein [Sedimentisphaera cyanobacteriorum]AQQ09774.1 hypothetical protein L21SP3_01587 [Sedimentisphaera cyanobacteriorum]
MASVFSAVRTACQLIVIGGLIIGSWSDLQTRITSLQKDVEMIKLQQQSSAGKFDVLSKRQAEQGKEIAVLENQIEMQKEMRK